MLRAYAAVHFTAPLFLDSDCEINLALARNPAPARSPGIGHVSRGPHNGIIDGTHSDITIDLRLVIH